MTKSPRVLHVIHSGAIGGGPKVVLELARRVPADHWIATADDGPLLHDAMAVGLETHRLPSSGEFSFAASIPWLARLCRSADLIHLHGQFAAFYGSIAARAACKPAVYTAHFPSFVTDSYLLNRMRNDVAERIPCAAAAAVVSCSEACRRAYLARRLCSPPKISTIYNGVPETRPIRDMTSTRAILQIGDSDPMVLAIGRFTAQKGFDLLIRAAPVLLAAIPSVKIVLVGDGELRSQLECLAQSLGVAGSVRFAGFRRDIADLYEAATIVAVPSRYEIFPLVPLEAMMAKRPVVATNLAVLREAIVPGVTGLLTSPNARDIAMCLAQLLQDTTAIRQMGEAGGQRAKEYFGADRMALQYSTLYSRVLGGRA